MVVSLTRRITFTLIDVLDNATTKDSGDANAVTSSPISAENATDNGKVDLEKPTLGDGGEIATDHPEPEKTQEPKDSAGDVKAETAMLSPDTGERFWGNITPDNADGVLANEIPIDKLARNVVQDSMDLDGRNANTGPVSMETTTDGSEFDPDSVVYPL
jgi:hypothetical protein